MLSFPCVLNISVHGNVIFLTGAFFYDILDLSHSTCLTKPKQRAFQRIKWKESVALESCDWKWFLTLTFFFDNERKESMSHNYFLNMKAKGMKGEKCVWDFTSISQFP